MFTIPEAVNNVMKAYADIGNFGAIFTFYSDLNKTLVSPNIATCHILLDAVIKNPNQSACHKIVAMVIRLLQGQDSLKPDVEFIHKVIKCCKVCDEYRQLQVIANLLDHHGVKVTPSLQKELKEVSQL